MISPDTIPILYWAIEYFRAGVSVQLAGMIADEYLIRYMNGQFFFFLFQKPV